MSDAYAIPGPWATAGRQARESRPQHQNHHEHRSGRRARREAYLAMMAANGADRGSDEPGDRQESRSRGSRSESERGQRRGRGRFGGPPFGGPGFGGRGGGRGRARRGDVRAAILALLAEGPRNGYGVIQEIEERSGGVWKPSPGAVYPALQQLEDEGLIRPVEIEGRKLFELTDTGRALVESAVDGPSPWDAVAAESGTGVRDAKHQIAQLWHAYSAVHQDGTPEQVAAASKVLNDARRSLYRILAEDDENAS